MSPLEFSEHFHPKYLVGVRKPRTVNFYFRMDVKLYMRVRVGADIRNYSVVITVDGCRIYLAWAIAHLYSQGIVWR